ncbi:uncharacterized protein LOC132804517 isoform X3 [Ziziphus jujuba]|uniref:Transcription repressor n=1 Tax=Ziziphus jujuba TaxID=326968 RepID=A0ABM4AEB6_ZIZJJ|nr:uncharacterized protein LOC132804517 isoform X3 [Ziziphus jujuba]
MVEMIVEKQIFSAKDLAQLLQCFLSLNSHHHHKVIVEVFTRKWRFDNEKMFTNICAILDVLFWSSIKGRYPIRRASRSTYSCDATLCSYVRGKSPKPSVSWRICDYCTSLSTMEVRMCGLEGPTY